MPVVYPLDTIKSTGTLLLRCLAGCAPLPECGVGYAKTEGDSRGAPWKCTALWAHMPAFRNASLAVCPPCVRLSTFSNTSTEVPGTGIKLQTVFVY